MTGISIHVDDKDLAKRLVKVEGLGEAPRAELFDGIGRLVQEQTRRRIESEKTAPDGTAWKPNRAGTSILYAEGHLARSVDYVSNSTGVQVGSGLIYARIHQLGGEIEPKNFSALKFVVAGDLTIFAKLVKMPARQWLGLSEENKRDVEGATIDWLEGLVQ